MAVGGDLVSLHLRDNYVFPAALWTAAWRRQNQQIADALGLLVLGRWASAGDACVLDGFLAGAVAGFPRLAVGRGLALYYDPTRDPSLSPYGVLAVPYEGAGPVTDEITSVTFAGGGSLGRVDLLYVTATDGTDQAESLIQILDPTVDPPTTDSDTLTTQRAAITALGVVAGDEDASPEADYASLPAGAIPLWEVLVPAGSADASDYTLTDVRPGVRAKRRDYYEASDAGDRDVEQFTHGEDLDARTFMGYAAEDGFPYFAHAVAPFSARLDWTPLVSTQGRSYWTRYGVPAPFVTASGYAYATYRGGARVIHTDTSVVDLAFTCAIPTPTRGQRVEAVTIAATVETVFSGGSAYMQLLARNSATGALTALTPLTEITTLGATGIKTVSATLAPSVVVPAGSYLYVEFSVYFTAGDVASSIVFDSVAVQTGEGYAP